MAYALPVYLFTGFLEGGKTHMIQESMESEQFNTGEKTLIIQCEEGIDELDVSQFTGKNVYLETIEDESELTLENLTALGKKHKLDRIIIEYNGMWMLNKLYEALPENWQIFQQMMFADANTFFAYNQNMRSLMVDKLMNCEMVVLTRTPASIDKEAVHKIVRGCSRRAQISYDYPDGHVEYDEIEDPLPFDMNAAVIDVADEDYAVWYRDLSEEMDVWNGKTVRFKGIVAREPRLGKNAFVAGRHVMTCCAADIAYHGLVCEFPAPVNEIKNRDWIMLTAKINVKAHKLYGSKPGPVLVGIKWEPSAKPVEEVATFY
ncbi:MAG: GTPase [Clostridia bacterium]|nr:GTPase [Clostridia bacterium]